VILWDTLGYTDYLELLPYHKNDVAANLHELILKVHSYNYGKVGAVLLFLLYFMLFYTVIVFKAAFIASNLHCICMQFKFSFTHS